MSSAEFVNLFLSGFDVISIADQEIPIFPTPFAKVRRTGSARRGQRFEISLIREAFC
ncbi:hypothetical protein BANRA_05246 [Klebsiella pneumoniae]|uniref:hypothetical protein n=1 Tax=Klebsiella pneumoniae TaxID=573 RepID=UPI000F198F2B|nr:hypothetical protein [Klebsiella pneumoniae]VDA25088.1 hypothetical protein BANRA_05246 [Klebsiella pneumoniae]